MTTIELHEVEREAEVDAAPYDDGAFSAMIERHRRSLRGHCYRILRSPDQADDAVQQTLLHAWRARGSFAGRAELGSWLYKIATNVCFDELERRQRRARPHRIRERLVPVEGCADGEPDVAAPSWTEPDGQVVAKESLAQACLTIFTLLPPKQRAVLILRDVLRWSACDTAELLDASVAAINSTLQRARATLAGARRRSGGVAPVHTKLGPAERVLLGRYVDAIGRPDPAAAVAAARVDVGGARSRTEEPLQHGAIADGSATCDWPSSVTRRTRGMLAATASAAGSKNSGLAPPVATKVGRVMVASRAVGALPSPMQAAS